MEKSSKRGKIPQADWPMIMSRHESGETLASIARTYDCSPPAISYIVSKSRARDSGEAKVFGELELLSVSNSQGSLAESQLEKNPAQSQRLAIVSAEPTRSDTVEDVPNAAPVGRVPVNGAAVPSGSHGQVIDARRTLHLSLGNDAVANDSSAGGGLSHSNGLEPVSSSPEPVVGRDRQAGPPAYQHRQEMPGPRPANGYNRQEYGRTEGADRQSASGGKNKEGGAFIDQALRQRVDGDIAAFLTAFDAALEQDNQASRAGLREATDRLLRAGARTRIELERLEARLPLPPRANIGQEQIWHHR